MKIYFAGSIRGGRNYAAVYHELIDYIGTLAQVLTEHISDSGLSASGEEEITDADIYARDASWIVESDAVIAEVSAPSLGVGYEIGVAEAMGKPVLCLFDDGSDVRLSAMLSGNPRVEVVRYPDIEAAKKAIGAFVAGLRGAST
jgi:hypothetical protein